MNRGRRNRRIRVDEPKDVSRRGARAGIHLASPARRRLQNAIAQRSRVVGGLIGTGSIDDQNFRLRRTVSQLGEESANEGSLVQDWDDDGYLRWLPPVRRPGYSASSFTSLGARSGFSPFGRRHSRCFPNGSAQSFPSVSSCSSR